MCRRLKSFSLSSPDYRCTCGVFRTLKCCVPEPLSCWQLVSGGAPGSKMIYPPSPRWASRRHRPRTVDMWQELHAVAVSPAGSADSQGDRSMAACPPLLVKHEVSLLRKPAKAQRVNVCVLNRELPAFLLLASSPSAAGQLQSPHGPGRRSENPSLGH